MQKQANPNTPDEPSAAAAEIVSMTGFARADSSLAGRSWAWEVRSVNSKSLDLRCRVPPGFDRFDPIARAEAAKRLKRGSVAMSLTMARTDSAVSYRLNRPLLDELLAVARDIEGAGAAPPRLDALLAVRGVIEPVEDDAGADEAIDASVAATLVEALDRLSAARAEEGARLAPTLREMVDRIDDLVDAARACAAAQPDALRARLDGLMSELLSNAGSLPEDRLAQEAALLVGKADIREELDRLAAHVAQARQLIAAGGVVGRRLDFLCQEFNREANTLCSKSVDVALTRIGLDLKATIEQFREQVQNIE